MALNYDSSPTDIHTAASSTTRTVVGLFEDELDMRTALDGLRKRGCRPEYVSIIVYDRETSDGTATGHEAAIAHAVGRSELNSSSQWLTRLSMVIVPERGAFLVGGPFGVALASLNTERAERELPSVSALAQTLCAFGFDDDEATYIDHRLAAGSLLVGVTCNDQNLVSTTHERFGDGNAVYLGSATTDSRLITNVTDLLAAPPEVFAEGDIVVTDAVAQLSGLCGSDHPLARLCGQQAVDQDGQDVGTVEEIIAESIQNGESSPEQITPRYLIIAHGGVLGIGRKRTAVPIDQASLDTTPLVVAADRDIIQRAPAWDADAPFSRREEHLVYTYFGAQPYWSMGDG